MQRISKYLVNPVFSKRFFATSAESATVAESGTVETYHRGLQWFHWIQAVGISGLVVSGYTAGKISRDPAVSSKKMLDFRSNMMNLHESFGLLMLGAMVPRIYFRLTKATPPMLPGAAIEHFTAKLTHGLLYAGIVFMPISGLAFGYLSGWGVPFFGWNVPGCSKEAAEKESYKNMTNWFYEKHHLVGQGLEILLPIHIGAVIYHRIKGQRILHRMNPLAKS
jgi:superoxide oxidase